MTESRSGQVDWKEMAKNNRILALILYIGAGLTGLGAIAGALNSIFDLAQRVDISDENNWLPRVYVQVLDWLSLAATIPVWLMLPIFALAVASVYLLVRQRTQLSKLSKELDELKSPSMADLDSSDERVLFWVKLIYDNTSTGLGPTPAIVAEAAKMPLSNVEASVDVLKQAGLIRLKKLKSDPLDLTAKGRDYFRSLEVLSRYDSFEIKLLNRRV